MKNYTPPNYGVRSPAIERRIAGNPPVEETVEDEEEEKASPAPKNKAKSTPANKSKGKK